MRVSILIASHGGRRWQEMALSRALPSAEQQGAHEVLIEHDPRPEANRAEVRNRLVAQSSGDWLVHLDADDELAPGYVDALVEMRAMLDQTLPVLLTPAVSYRTGGRIQEARFWPVCDLRGGNWMVVGTALTRELFDQVGGWKHLDSTGRTNEYDDWHLWCRCVKAGATPIKVPKAIYIAHILTSSPHRRATQRQKLAWHEEVYQDVWA